MNIKKINQLNFDVMLMLNQKLKLKKYKGLKIEFDEKKLMKMRFKKKWIF